MKVSEYVKKLFRFNLSFSSPVTTSLVTGKKVKSIGSKQAEDLKKMGNDRNSSPWHRGHCAAMCQNLHQPHSLDDEVEHDQWR